METTQAVTNSGLAEGVKRVECGGGAPALTLLDLDQLKPTNDAHGDRPGDACMVHYAEALGRNLRAGVSAFQQVGTLQPSAVTCQHFSISAFWFRLLPLPRSWTRGSRWIKFSANRIDEVFCGATRLACASRTNPPISREVL